MNDRNLTREADRWTQDRSIDNAYPWEHQSTMPAMVVAVCFLCAAVLIGWAVWW